MNASGACLGQSTKSSVASDSQWFAACLFAACLLPVCCLKAGVLTAHWSLYLHCKSVELQVHKFLAGWLARFILGDISSIACLALLLH